MMSRRNALLAGIGLAGIAAYARNIFALGPHVGAEKFEVSKTEAEWKQGLTHEQFQVLRKGGTERPYSSALDNEHRPGLFACAACDLPLFRSETKFDTGTGWPSFFAPIEDAVRTSNTACSFHERKCIAGAAAVISATCSTTGPSRLGSATA